MQPDDHRALFVGDGQHSDFRAIRLGLPSAIDYRFPHEVCEDSAGRSVGLLVLAQSRRDQFSPREAARLRQAFPAAVPVNLLSSLCEGETRSGRPLVGWNRVLWYRWPAEFSRFAGGDRFVWTTDPDTKPNERLLERTLGTAGGLCRHIVLLGRNARRLETLREVVQLLGHTATTMEGLRLDGAGENRPWNACVVAGDSLDLWVQRTVDQVRRYRRMERVVVLLNFPRAAEIEWLQRKCGSRVAVVGQPFELPELHHALSPGAAVAVTRPAARMRSRRTA